MKATRANKLWHISCLCKSNFERVKIKVSPRPVFSLIAQPTRSGHPNVVFAKYFFLLPILSLIESVFEEMEKESGKSFSFFPGISSLPST